MTRIILLCLLIISINADTIKEMKIDNLQCAVVSNDAKQLYIVTQDEIVTVGLKDFSVLKETAIPLHYNTSKCILLENDLLLYKADHGKVVAFNTKKGRVVQEYKAPQKIVMLTYTVSKDKKYLYSVEPEYFTNNMGSYAVVYGYELKTGKRSKIVKLRPMNELYAFYKGTLYMQDSIIKQTSKFDVETRTYASASVDAYKKARLLESDQIHKLPKIKNRQLLYIDKTLFFLDENATVPKRSKKVHYSFQRPSIINELAINYPLLVSRNAEDIWVWNLQNGSMQNYMHRKMQIYGEADTEIDRGIVFLDKNNILVTPLLSFSPSKSNGLTTGIIHLNLETSAAAHLQSKYSGPIAVNKTKDMLLISGRKNVLYDLRTMQQLKIEDYPKVVSDLKEVLDLQSKSHRNLREKRYEYKLSKDNLIKRDLTNNKIVKQVKLKLRTWELQEFKKFPWLLVQGVKRFVIVNKHDLKPIAYFESYDHGEWLIWTPKGYYSASSKKLQKNIKRYLHLTDANYLSRYRPDIIARILSNKAYGDLVRQKKRFILADKTMLHNMYGADVLKNIVLYAQKTGDYKYLNYFKKIEPTAKTLNVLLQAIEQEHNNTGYYYKMLRRFYAYDTILIPFLQKRMTQLDVKSDEWQYLVGLVYKLRYKKKYRPLLNQLKNSPNIGLEGKKIIVNHLKENELADYADTIWEVWEKLHYVKKEHLAFLQTLDAKRVIKYQHKDALFFLEKSRKNIKIYTKKTIQQKERVNPYGVIADIERLTYLNKEIDLHNEIDEVLHVMTYNLRNHISSDAFMMAGAKFVLKHGSVNQQKQLKKEVKRFFNTIQPVRKNEFLITDYLEILHLIDPQMAQEKALYYLQKTAISKHVLYNLQFSNIQSESIAKELFKYVVKLQKEYKTYKAMTEGGYALRALLNYNAVTQEKLIGVLNGVKECTDIPSFMLTNSVIKRSVSADTFEKYKCAKIED